MAPLKNNPLMVSITLWCQSIRQPDVYGSRIKSLTADRAAVGNRYLSFYGSARVRHMWCTSEKMSMLFFLMTRVSDLIS